MAAEDGRRLRYRHRRDELLHAATEHVLQHGLTGLTLRRVAQSAGVSHGALLHHFSTRGQLVAEVVSSVMDRALSDPDLVSGSPQGSPLRALWHHACAPDGQRLVRGFVAITGVALYEADDDIGQAVRTSVRERVGLLRDGLVSRGWPTADAEPLATLALATLRGLATDRLVTGDTARVDAAFEVFAHGFEAPQTPGPTRGD